MITDWPPCSLAPRPARFTRLHRNPSSRCQYADRFSLLEKRLSKAEFEAIEARINELGDEAGGEIATAGWLPGNNWTGTPFDPIYQKAAKRDHTLSAQLFGLFVWYTIMRRPEAWASGRAHGQWFEAADTARAVEETRRAGDEHV